MSMYWTTDSEDFANYGCGGAPTWTTREAIESDRRWRDVPAGRRAYVRQMYGTALSPYERTNVPMAGALGYEPGSLPPVIHWHPCARFAAWLGMFVFCGACWFALFVALPVIGGWLRGGR